MIVNTFHLFDRLRSNIYIGIVSSKNTQITTIRSVERETSTWRLMLLFPQSTFVRRITVKDQNVVVDNCGECSIRDALNGTCVVIKIRKDDGGVADREWLEKRLAPFEPLL